MNREKVKAVRDKLASREPIEFPGVLIEFVDAILDDDDDKALDVSGSGRGETMTLLEAMTDYGIPAHMQHGLRRYLDDHIEPGAFLRAFLSNDLRLAVSLADDSNLWKLRAYVGFLDAHAPAAAWGSEEAVKRWLRQRG